MDKVEEKAFVSQLVKMDNGAWELLCREYWLPLTAYIQHRFGCDREKSEEIIQMTFLRCVRSIRKFKPSRGRLFEWLKAICRNEAHTFLRRSQKHSTIKPLFSQAGNISDGVLEKIDRRAMPSEVLERKEVQLLIHETIMELYSRYRKALIMKYVENKKVSEIATRLGQSEKATESLLSRSREAFREVFLRKLKGPQLQVRESVK